MLQVFSLFFFFFFVLFIIIRSGRLAEISDPFVSQNPWRVCTSHSPGQTQGCAYTICSYGQTSIFCTISCGSPCPFSRTWSYIFFCTNLLHSLMWLIVSSLTPHDLHLLFFFLFFCFLFFLGGGRLISFCFDMVSFLLLYDVVFVLFCTTIKRDSVSLLRFPFLRNVHVSRVRCRLLVA